jgi:hypothetical protein
MKWHIDTEELKDPSRFSFIYLNTPQLCCAGAPLAV